MPHDSGDPHRGQNADEEMYMINMTLQGQDLDPLFFAFSNGQLFKPCLHAGDLEDLSAVTGAKHKVVVDQ